MKPVNQLITIKTAKQREKNKPLSHLSYKIH